MTDEDYLEALAAQASEQPLLDARWDALAAGELSDADRAALETLAKSTPLFTDAIEAFSPRAETLGQKIRGEIALTLAQPAPTPSPQTLLPPKRYRWLLSGTLVAAVLLAIFVPGRDPTHLPRYQLATQSGEKVLRGDQDRTWSHQEYRPGSMVDIVIRPLKDTQESVGLKIFFGSDSFWTPVPLELSPSASGAFHILQPIEDFLPTVLGVQELLFVIGAPDELPGVDAELRAGLKSDPSQWQLLRLPYERILR